MLDRKQLIKKESITQYWQGDNFWLIFYLFSRFVFRRFKCLAILKTSHRDCFLFATREPSSFVWFPHYGWLLFFCATAWCLSYLQPSAKPQLFMLLPVRSFEISSSWLLKMTQFLSLKRLIQLSFISILLSHLDLLQSFFLFRWKTWWESWGWDIGDDDDDGITEWNI